MSDNKLVSNHPMNEALHGVQHGCMHIQPSYLNPEEVAGIPNFTFCHRLIQSVQLLPDSLAKKAPFKSRWRLSPRQQVIGQMWAPTLDATARL